MVQRINEWKVSGEVFYLKELEGEFGASLKLRGSATRPNVYTSNILEFSCLMTREVYDEAKRLGLRQYHNATLSGHLESWYKGNDERNLKIYFIVDKVEKVGGYK